MKKDKVPTSGTLFKYGVVVVLTAFFVVFLASCNLLPIEDHTYYAPTRIGNPYEDVNFELDRRMKAELHTHTNVSIDGNLSVEQILHLYASMGYCIVAITDHSAIGFKDDDGNGILEGTMQVLGREMFVIGGNEISRGHHFNNLFVNRAVLGAWNTPRLMERQVDAFPNSTMFINHPGRYRRSIGFYVNLFQNQNLKNNLVGMEVINRADRYGTCRLIWDHLLSRVAPARQVFGFANDDFHIWRETRNDFNHSWNQFFVRRDAKGNVDFRAIQDSIHNGRSFFFSRATVPNTSRDIALPSVDRVEVCQYTLTISVFGDFDSIEWISYVRNGDHGILNSATYITTDVAEGTSEISVVGAGARRFVRFVLTNGGGQLFSQPFLLPAS